MDGTRTGSVSGLSSTKRELSTLIVAVGSLCFCWPNCPASRRACAFRARRIGFAWRPINTTACGGCSSSYAKSSAVLTRRLLLFLNASYLRRLASRSLTFGCSACATATAANSARVAADDGNAAATTEAASAASRGNSTCTHATSDSVVARNSSSHLVLGASSAPLLPERW